MQHSGFVSDWDDASLLSVFRSPFLLPSIILHVVLMLFALRAAKLSFEKPARETPITVQLQEPLGKDTKSIGPAQGPGGRRELPKLGTPAPQRAQTGKLDSGSFDAPPVATPDPEPAVSNKPAPLPGPKVLASSNPSPVAAKESSPESLVQLPTKATSSALPSAAPGAGSSTQHHATAMSGEAAPLRGLSDGAQIPGSLKSTGVGTGPSGVPGGSRTGAGLSGGGSGSGTGGGGTSGLKGASNLDFNRYLEQLEKRVKAMWKYPEEVSGVQEVTVRFSLDRAGKLIEARVLDSSDSRLNTSAIEAMKRASPFPPIPESLKELANEPLIVRFKVSIRVRG